MPSYVLKFCVNFITQINSINLDITISVILRITAVGLTVKITSTILALHRLKSTGFFYHIWAQLPGVKFYYNLQKDE